MDSMKYSGERWLIVYGDYSGLEEFAVNEMYKLMQPYIPYILTVSDSSVTNYRLENYNIVFIGTASSNSYIREFLKNETIKLNNQKKEAYIIKSMNGTFNQNKRSIIIAGTDSHGVLYAIRDFEHYYFNQTYMDTSLYKNYNIFTEINNSELINNNLYNFEIVSSPQIENRDLWTWGHVIYDYKRYIDNMSKWKMNMLIIWNDYAPVNAKQVVQYAHSRGIKVIWGYSWGWGESVDPTDENQLIRWTDRAIQIYDEQYAHLGGDGVYFQLFTETNENTINNISIAELAVKWVNHIGKALLQKHSDLWLQFGLHATSVFKEYYKFNEIDSGINIMWEDAGSFPYSYNAKVADDIHHTLKFTDNISKLRGAEEDFGIVVKGLITLDWKNFEHQRGPFILGEMNDKYIKSRTREKSEAWKYIQTYWTQNFKYLLETINIIKQNKIKRTSIAALLEDGMWEGKMWYPVALFAESLWNPNENAQKIIEKVMLTKDVTYG